MAATSNRARAIVAAVLVALVVGVALSIPTTAYAETVPEGEPPAEATEACPAGGEHDFSATVVQQATEDVDGVRRYTCTKCGYTFDMLIPHTGHDWGPWVIDQEPTCTSEGLEHRTCNRYPDNPHTEYEVLPMLSSDGEHTWVESDRLEPTATEDGWVKWTCSVCGATYTETLPATGVVSEATPDATTTAETAETAEAPAAEPTTTEPATTQEPAATTSEPTTETEAPADPGFWSFAPTVVDVACATIDLAAVAVAAILVVPLVPVLIWVRRRREAALDAYLDDATDDDDGDDDDADGGEDE